MATNPLGSGVSVCAVRTGMMDREIRSICLRIRIGKIKISDARIKTHPLSALARSANMFKDNRELKVS
uniref:Uncharacterized protein n=1 Tax=Candidatus Kentrum sp. TUN TaxID=2126343 RepID=A0A451AI41_9GAMM|nr:MAG: hypothetical protein BECKTUN1418F_GA0071002_109410 [Candidatus Kentron sp. TUN]VFK65665.1 MAG: hypothetical protein BECKTUN1418E_GA0071001_11118 [Candidatus Kentron sp. TUN]